MNQLVALAFIVTIFWYSLPGFTTPVRRAGLVLSTLFLPVVGWAWTLWVGYGARQERAIARNAQAHLAVHYANNVAQHRRNLNIEFQREMLAHGTPVEKMNASALLAMWGAPEQAEPIAPPPPVLVLNDERDLAYVRSVVGKPVVIGPLPSGRVLTRAERWVVRNEGAGILYIPANLIAGMPAYFACEDCS